MSRSSTADADLSIPSLLARARARRGESRPRLAHISASMLALARQRLAPRSPPPGSTYDPFKPAVPPPNVVPSGHKSLAMDQDISFQAEWAAGSLAAGAAAFSSAWQEGTVFPGYPFLVSLAQRPEYRRLSEVIATEMTRRWIRFGSSGGDDKTERIADLTDELDRLETRDRFRKLAELDGYFGRSHLYLDTGSTDDRDELRTPIGDGRGQVSRAKFGGRKGFLKALRVVEPYWVYPTNYDSNDPLRGAWYEPEQWYVMGKEVHASRLLRFVGREVPDMLKPAYSFGGLSMSQMALPYVNNWLRTRQSVADIVHAFSVFVLATNMSETLGPDGDQLFARLELFNLCRDNRGVMAIDKDAEQFQNVSAPLGGLHELQAQTQEHLSSVSGIPVVKLLGITPSGLNASSDGEMRAFYDWVHAFQEKFFRPGLTRIIDFASLSLWGEVDQDITFEFEPLWALDEKGEAEVCEIKARTGAVLVEGGIVSQVEERTRVAADPSSGYDSLDAEAVPDLEQEESEGLVPKGGGRVSAELVDGGEGEAPEERGESGEDEEDDGPLHRNFLSGMNPLSSSYLAGRSPLTSGYLKNRIKKKEDADA